MNEEHKERLRKINTGKKRSAEHRKKISEAMRKKWEKINAALAAQQQSEEE